MTIAYFDCFSGAGGDMIVASLLDAGADADALRGQLSSLNVAGYAIKVEKVRKQGIASTRFLVELDQQEKQPHRHLKHVLAIIDGATALPSEVKERSSRVFTRLAEAEAAVHGTTIEKVHFHEVGAIDAIVDVVGAVAALRMLGVTRVVCSPVVVGSGTVACEHGIMPVPAPATAFLLRGFPIATSDETGELLTPTAAALLTTLAESFGPMPSMTIGAVGHGAGTRDGARRPNVLRVMIGEPTHPGTTGLEADEVVVFETNLDDSTPQVIGHAMERLLDEGALDVFLTPIQMKKNRPGVMLTALCEPGDAARLEAVIFAETTTFGVRRHRCARSTLRRRFVTVETKYGPVRMKIGEGGARPVATPEYEDCREAAARCGVAFPVVLAAARHAWDHHGKK